LDAQQQQSGGDIVVKEHSFLLLTKNLDYCFRLDLRVSKL
jgi:hypothetical protein